VLEGTRVNAIRDSARRGESIRQLVRRFGVSRNTIRRYLRLPVKPREQSRVRARRLPAALVEDAKARFAADPDRNAAALHRWFRSSGFTVSVRTIRRLLAGLRDPSSAAPGRAGTVDVDLDILRRVVRAHRCSDPDELESLLTLQLANMTEQARKNAEDWPAFLWTVLTRKARNWLRDQARYTERLLSLDKLPVGDDTSFAEPAGGEDAVPDDRLALERVGPTLRAFDRRVLAALVAESFNKTRAAKRLGVHRNTVDSALHRVRRALGRLER
jgi:DNA-directed RNA polymerase specialized sigma24 family protein